MNCHGHLHQHYLPVGPPIFILTLLYELATFNHTHSILAPLILSLSQLPSSDGRTVIAEINFTLNLKLNGFYSAQ